MGLDTNINELNDYMLDHQVEEATDIITSGYKNVIPFPYSHMRKVMIGLTRGELMVVGGRPGHTKTTWTLALCHELVKKGYKVMIISKEMPAFRLLHKLVTAISPMLTSYLLRQGNLNTEQKAELERVMNVIKKEYAGRLWIFDDKYSIDDVEPLVKEYRPDVIMDDYLQITKMTHNGSERQELTRLVLKQKDIAVKHMLAYISISQLNRSIEIRDNPYPVTSDLAGSDGIGWVGADVFMIHYGHKLDPAKYPKDRVSVICTKSRYAEARAFHFKFDGNHMLYTPLISRS